MNPPPTYQYHIKIYRSNDSFYYYCPEYAETERFAFEIDNSMEIISQ